MDDDFDNILGEFDHDYVPNPKEGKSDEETEDEDVDEVDGEDVDEEDDEDVDEEEDDENEKDGDEENEEKDDADVDEKDYETGEEETNAIAEAPKPLLPLRRSIRNSQKNNNRMSWK